MHVFVRASSTSKKRANWDLLNRKVLSKLFDYELPDALIDSCIVATPQAIEKVLLIVKLFLPKKDVRRKISRSNSSVNDFGAGSSYIDMKQSDSIP